MSIGNMSTHISTFPFNREIIRLYFIKTPSRVAHLFNAGLVRVVQGPGLHVLGHQGHAHPGDLVPVVQHPQGQLLKLQQMEHVVNEGLDALRHGANIVASRLHRLKALENRACQRIRVRVRE